MNIEDCDFLTELRLIRENVNPADPRPVYAGQGLLLESATSTAKAARQLLVRMNGALAGLEHGEIVARHPLVEAYSVLMHHPEVSSRPKTKLSDEQATALDVALAEMTQEWSASQLEWKLVIYLQAAGGHHTYEPVLGFAGQVFKHPTLARAWSSMIDLAVYRGMGLL